MFKHLANIQVASLVSTNETFPGHKVIGHTSNIMKQESTLLLRQAFKEIQSYKSNIGYKDFSSIVTEDFIICNYCKYKNIKVENKLNCINCHSSLNKQNTDKRLISKETILDFINSMNNSKEFNYTNIESVSLIYKNMNSNKKLYLDLLDNIVGLDSNQKNKLLGFIQNYNYYCDL